jgi:putative CocE/NonD family hydrolase
LIPSVLYNTVFAASGIFFPPTRFDDLTYSEAKAAFEAEPPVRILFEEGAAEGLKPGSPVQRFDKEFDAWPIPGTQPTELRLSTRSGKAAYTYDPDAVPDTFYSGSLADIWKANVRWDWKPAPRGAVVAFEGPNLSADQVMVGPASADLWITSTTPDTDLEVTITEVRPDGNEVYVQSGWLRASQRALDPAGSTALRPLLTQTEADAAPLVVGEPTAVRVEILPFAHVFRKGSRVRVIVGSPGGNRAQWRFENLPKGGTVTVLSDAAHPSRVMLPVVPGIDVPAAYPACGSLRGQPCRAYMPT